MNVLKDSTSTTDALFDSTFLFPKKKKVDFLMGGIFFRPAAA
jgi:hypothetical protein